MVGVAVKVKAVPEHAGFEPEVKAIETAGTKAELTIIVTPELTEVAGLAHDELEVTIQVKISPFISVELVNVGELVPAFVPFICHW